jgi:hypothetical protein
VLTVSVAVPLALPEVTAIMSTEATDGNHMVLAGEAADGSSRERATAAQVSLEVACTVYFVTCSPARTRVQQLEDGGTRYFPRLTKPARS